MTLLPSRNAGIVVSSTELIHLWFDQALSASHLHARRAISLAAGGSVREVRKGRARCSS